MTDSPATLVVQQPANPAQQLFLLFHGVGGEPQNLLALAQRLAGAFPAALVACVAGPEDFDASPGPGYQWFSIRGVNEGNRAERVAQALPRFEQTVRHWQARSGVSAEATALIGFSQGAIMSLAASQAAMASATPIAARVLSLSGRFSELPALADQGVTYHLVHGKQDDVIPYRHTIEAAERLVDLGGDVTADVLPFVGHEVSDEVMDLVLQRLQTHVPRRLWEAAMAAAAQGGAEAS